MQEELKQAAGKTKIAFAPPRTDETLHREVLAAAENRIKQAIRISGKTERRSAMHQIEKETIEALLPAHENQESAISTLVENLEAHLVRDMILKERTRIGGRGFSDLRPISCEVGILPRAHGSALFTRGETQVLASTTLGTTEDEQRIDSLMHEGF